MDNEESGKPKGIKKVDLAGRELRQELCLVQIDSDGTLYLCHLEGAVFNSETDEWEGYICFNGEVRLPLSQFDWTGRN